MYAFDASTFDVEVARAKSLYLVPVDCVTVKGERRVPWTTLRRYISETGWAIWAYLSGLARNSKEGRAWPSVASIRCAVARRHKAVTERTIFRALQRLEAAGLVSVATKENGLWVRQICGREIPTDSMALYVPENTCKWLARAKPMNRPKKQKDVRVASKSASGGETRRKESREKSKMPSGSAGASSSPSAASPPQRGAVQSRRARPPETHSVDVALPPASAETVVVRCPELPEPLVLPSVDLTQDSEWFDLFDEGETMETFSLLPPSAGVTEEAPVVDRAAQSGRATDEGAPQQPRRSKPSTSSTALTLVPPDLGDVDPATHTLRDGGPDARREVESAAWRDEVAAMEAPTLDRQEHVECEAALPAEERGRRSLILDSLFAPMSTMPSMDMPVTHVEETPSYDYDDPASYAEIDNVLREMFECRPTRIPLDLTGLLPEFPSELPRVQSPRFESLSNTDGSEKSEYDSVQMLARSFRMAMNGHYGGKFHHLRNGDITKSQYYAKLVTAAELLRKYNIHPSLWCFWSIKRWREKNPIKHPPLGWVFSEKLIKSCHHWFDEDVRAYQVQHLVPTKMEMLKLVNETRHAALKCQTRQEAAAVIEKRIPPDLWRALCRRAHDEAHQMAMEIRARFANEEWTWGKF